MARVEGEGALTIRLRGGRVDDVQLRIFERLGSSRRSCAAVPSPRCPISPRGSADLPGRLPDELLSRPGIAPGHLPARPLGAVRRLLYCGEWIESHVLHVTFLHAPDFLGYESAIAMAQDRPEHADAVRAALRLKKAGNAIVEVLGGRAIHPVNVRLGGFYRLPRRSEMSALGEQLKGVQDIARDLVRWTAGLEFPPFEHDYEFVAMRHESDYPMNEGRLVSSHGLDIALGEFAEHFEEYQVPYSNALQCRHKGGGAYFVGPLARWNLNADRATPEIRELARESGIAWPCNNPSVSIVVRALETAYAVQEVLRVIQAYDPPEAPFVSYEPRAGRAGSPGAARDPLPAL